jgi:hypothetical protein
MPQSFASYGSFMQPTSPEGEDNRRKASAFTSLDNPNNTNQSYPAMFAPDPNRMYPASPRKAASLSHILNPSRALRVFGMGNASPLPFGTEKAPNWKDWFSTLRK